jgi:23S rRNA pseudouridine1911/1915/1917 synthase
MKRFSYCVDAPDVHKRLDVYLAEHNTSLTRSHIKKLIDSLSVTVNRHQVKVSYRLKLGDLIELLLEKPREPQLVAENLPLDILFEDDFIIVVNKPAGMVVHPAAGNYSGTLVNALLYHCSFIQGVGGILRPGIVHRLDKGTSGVIVVAKSDSAQLNLTRQFKNRTVKKIYTAMVFGQFAKDEGQIETDIGRHRYDRKKMSTHTAGGRTASTRWVVKGRFTNFSLLDVIIQTGRTHQIRVHLASLHHPILGDSIYGNRKLLSKITDTNLRGHCSRLKRPFLHARLLGFYHPQNGNFLEFESPLAPELKELLSIIEKAG